MGIDGEPPLRFGATQRVAHEVRTDTDMENETEVLSWQ
jgi:hypothetical protein